MPTAALLPAATPNTKHTAKMTADRCGRLGSAIGLRALASRNATLHVHTSLWTGAPTASPAGGIGDFEGRFPLLLCPAGVRYLRMNPECCRWWSILTRTRTFCRVRQQGHGVSCRQETGHRWGMSCNMRTHRRCQPRRTIQSGACNGRRTHSGSQFQCTIARKYVHRAQIQSDEAAARGSTGRRVHFAQASPRRRDMQHAGRSTVASSVELTRRGPSRLGQRLCSC